MSNHDSVAPVAMLPPALRQLIRAQSAAKLRRFTRAFRDRRRLPLSIIGVILAGIWLGNICLSILFRQPTPAQRFTTVVTVGLMVYGLWHVVKTAFRRPEDSFEWTSAERELLCGGPFYRYQLIAYRLAGIFNATLTKAVVFTLLMLPDLRQPVAGFCGIVLGLLFLDLLRLVVEVSAHGSSKRNYLWFRGCTIALLTGFLIATLTIAFSSPSGWHEGSSNLTLTIVKHLFASAGTVLDGPVGGFLTAPFHLFALVISTASFSLSWWSHLAICAALVAILGWLVVRLDRHYAVELVKRERQSYSELTPTQLADGHRPTVVASRRIHWLAGAGPIVWRQMVGARKQQGTLLVALALPGILAILPVWVCRDGRQAALNVAAAVTFYSFLLLPTALKYDFRRDLKRMVVLKTLPVRSWALVLGQVATPALLAFAFQTTVLLLTMIVRPYPAWMLATILILLAQLNFMIFAVDNFLYLLYPYRLNQEGLEIFLRTTLTFTAKGLVFVGGLGAALAWSQIVRWMYQYVSADVIHPGLVFALGGSVMLTACTLTALRLLANAYDRFDPSQDIPG